MNYESQSARDAQARNYGSERYWSYLDEAALSSAAYWARQGNNERSASMLTRSLSEALRGNDGD
jgi:hypothetical protein